MPETNQERPVAPRQFDSADPGPDTPSGPTSERSGSNGMEIKDLRAAFHKLEESKSRFVKRIQEIRRVSSTNADVRAHAELELKNAQHQLAQSNGQLSVLKDEVSSLRAELNTAKGLLEEIDRTLT